jgi:NAD(P)-dependent dehydrogenase (short-subunit alcohol dehydrogenase family)
MHNHRESGGREFDGLTALVTGSSNGIGAETAVRLAEQGARVLVHYHRDRASAEKVRERCGGGEILSGDLGSIEGVHQFVKDLKEPVDILINNAGSLVERQKFLDVREDLWDRVMTLNLTSVVLITQAVLPHMVEKKRGIVVNVSSIAGRHGGGVGAIPYSTSKAAVSTLTRGLAKEFASQGIRVNAVSPGTIETNFHKQFSTAQMLDSVRAQTPAGRLGNSEETADVIVFLCSDAARFIHGQVLEVNGGLLMP